MTFIDLIASGRLRRARRRRAVIGGALILLLAGFALTHAPLRASARHLLRMSQDEAGRCLFGKSARPGGSSSPAPVRSVVTWCARSLRIRVVALSRNVRLQRAVLDSVLWQGSASAWQND